ncbi:hypothetical protein AB2M62_16620 [Sphingomonas sp. MMS12-HWE2-04]|uniref:hypothetical protein n=1 Tax=Sphingomonas sp. MMS12-HWE2-04 TaxID=3234199 RepID=UPI00384BDAFC
MRTHLAGLLVALVLLPDVSLAQTGPGNASSVNHGGRAFGRVEKLEGVYFTNFENSVFTPCAGPACEAWADKIGYNVDCRPELCAELERRIVALNGSHDTWALFAVTFYGRRTTRTYPKTSLHDRGQSFLLEHVGDFRLLEMQN